jgi:hypothetical protein
MVFHTKWPSFHTPNNQFHTHFICLPPPHISRLYPPSGREGGEEEAFPSLPPGQSRHGFSVPPLTLSLSLSLAPNLTFSRTLGALARREKEWREGGRE